MSRPAEQTGLTAVAARESGLEGWGPNRLRNHFRALIREQLVYRELLFAIVRRDLTVRYKQTIMGFGWAIFTPLVYMLVFSVIFTRVVPLETDLPYPIYAYAGLLPWNLFASSLASAAASLVGNKSLITKVYFPREIFPFAAVLVALVNFGVASLVLAFMMMYYGIGVSWTALMLPAVILVQLAFTGGIALLLAMTNLFFRDVKYLVGMLLTVWMLATSVVYPIERIGGRLGAILALNPMTPIIDAYRSLLLRGELPAFGPFAAAAIISFATLGIAWIVFHRAEPSFAERV